jgi:hypothetical protein
MKPFRIVREVLKAQGVFTLSFALLLFLTGGYFFGMPQFAQAAALTSVSDTISSSTPGANANHTILFVTPTGINGASETITLTFDSSPAFDLTGIVEDDVDIAEDTGAPIGDCASFAAEKTTAASASGTEWGVAVSGQVLTLTHPTAGGTEDIAAGACVQVQIGTNATSFGSGANQINNASKVAAVGTADIYTIDINVNSGDDTGTAMTASIEGVDVSVTVVESLTFSIAAVADTTCATITDGVGAEVTSTVGATITVPFGTPTVNTFVDGCLDLTVATNATDGYSTTVEKSQVLTSGSDTIADGNCDGSCANSTIAAWDTASAANSGFAYCMKDATGNAAATADANWTAGANQCGGSTQGFKLFPTTTTTEAVMASAAPTADDTSNTGYRLVVPGAQEPGTYTTTITYITTPTF